MTTIPGAAALLELTIADLIRKYPAALAVLTANGCAAMVEPANLSLYGQTIRLGTLLRSLEINAELFCAQISGQPAAEAYDREPAGGSGNLSLLALLPCPLKVPLEEAFLGFAAELPAEERALLTFRIEGNANSQLDYADYADHFQSLEDMPDIIITPGFNSFFHRGFVDRFIKTGLFKNVSDYPGDRQLATLGVTDPEGHYTMLAMNLLVFVADLDRLAGRAAPGCWADLMDERYADSIAIRGNKDGTFCETLLLTVYREFGEEGLRRLGRNVRYGWHPSQMVKAALSGADDAPAICVMPLFFANNLKNRARLAIVWPEDGALVSPVTMLVKAQRRAPLARLVEFLAGPEVARICAGAFFPAVHPEVDNRLPEGASFKWIGWEYLKNNDLKGLIATCNEVFRQAYRGGAP